MTYMSVEFIDTKTGAEVTVTMRDPMIIGASLQKRMDEVITFFKIYNYTVEEKHGPVC